MKKTPRFFEARGCLIPISKIGCRCKTSANGGGSRDAEARSVLGMIFQIPPVRTMRTRAARACLVRHLYTRASLYNGRPILCSHAPPQSRASAARASCIPNTGVFGANGTTQKAKGGRTQTQPRDVPQKTPRFSVSLLKQFAYFKVLSLGTVYHKK